MPPVLPISRATPPSATPENHSDTCTHEPNTVHACWAGHGARSVDANAGGPTNDGLFLAVLCLPLYAKLRDFLFEPPKCRRQAQLQDVKT